MKPIAGISNELEYPFDVGPASLLAEVEHPFNIGLAGDVVNRSPSGAGHLNKI